MANNRQRGCISGIRCGMMIGLAALLACGCFPMQAPDRLPVCRSVEEARVQAGDFHLDLSGKGLKAFPMDLRAFPGLRRLSLRGNSLGEVRDGPDGLDRLQWLDIGRAGVTALGSSFGSLAGLQTLYAGDNDITSLPEEIGNMSALRYLNLDRNRLERLPETIGALSKLRWLRLNGNRLDALPPSIARLQALERLYLRDNRLESLPEDVSELKNLTLLALEGNPLPEEERERIRQALPDCEVTF